jgi:hypothetical protein
MCRDGEDLDYIDDLDDDICESCGDPLEECTCGECALMPDGQCMLVGTEFCDWDCGRLNADRIDAMKANETKSN